MSHTTIISALESLLFVSGEPLTITRLEKILNVSKQELDTSINVLAKKYQDDSASGLLLIQDEKSILLATKPGNVSFVEALTKSSLQENMSRAALEVLAIIAYRAPIARVDIDAIRGVNCSFTLRNLLLRDLIAREGNPGDNRGYLYRPTLKFLQVLGLQTVVDLPDYETLSQDERLRLILEEDLAKETKTE